MRLSGRYCTVAQRARRDRDALLRPVGAVCRECAHPRYEIDGQHFEIYDVGGQRSERKKWLPLLNNVTAIIFVAALLEYDQKLQEDLRMNRMVEAIGLFKSVVNHDAY